MQGFLYWNRSAEERQAALTQLIQWLQEVCISSLYFLEYLVLPWKSTLFHLYILG